MISPKVSILMVALSVMGASAPLAAMAQPSADNTATQAIGVETGRNTQVNYATVDQDAENEVEISSEAEAEGGDSGHDDKCDKCGHDDKWDKSGHDDKCDECGRGTSAEAETEVEDSVVFAASNQESDVNQNNDLSDDDTVTVTATQTADQTAVAADVEIILADLLDGLAV
jgi:hypothetical protein